ncbi:subclass B1 metallo-beta-lactamase [Erythrobacter sp. SDW2]|uniref:subclass B1 metallo-beta-lactamase n=1 Tax=Erythrobacter sp. SDW2 TaxID=2907154 RepID=UPI001F235F8E|nr:subclass B1 metallo-beta-lactamase [Erythrobacter sp. SDW2]UIP05510.1 subclass B1 metallo-beta-lactamase [Erythrobacter sp. SDW2]
MTRLLFALSCIAFSACIPSEIRAPVAEQEAGRDVVRFGEVSFTELRPGVWQHTTYLDLMGFGPVPSNGLLVVDGESSLLVDTAWTEYQTAQILRWAAEVLGKPVRAAVVTHAHQDKMGGIGALNAAGLPSWANPLSNELAPQNDLLPASNALAFDAQGWAIGAGAAVLAPLKVYFPGGAHTRDNITVGLPDIGLAFGGCMIKGSDAPTLGNLGDADTAAYARSVRNFSAAFPDAGLIVMSHSPPEGREAIARSLALALELAEELSQ